VKSSNDVDYRETTISGNGKLKWEHSNNQRITINLHATTRINGDLEKTRVCSVSFETIDGRSFLS